MCLLMGGTGRAVIVTAGFGFGFRLGFGFGVEGVLDTPPQQTC